MCKLCCELFCELKLFVLSWTDGAGALFWTALVAFCKLFGRCSCEEVCANVVFCESSCDVFCLLLGATIAISLFCCEVCIPFICGVTAADVSVCALCASVSEVGSVCWDVCILLCCVLFCCEVAGEVFIESFVLDISVRGSTDDVGFFVTGGFGVLIGADTGRLVSGCEG